MYVHYVRGSDESEEIIRFRLTLKDTSLVTFQPKNGDITRSFSGPTRHSNASAFLEGLRLAAQILSTRSSE